MTCTCPAQRDDPTVFHGHLCLCVCPFHPGQVTVFSWARMAKRRKRATA